MKSLAKIKSMYKLGYTCTNSTQLKEFLSDLSFSFNGPTKFGINDPIVIYFKHSVNVETTSNHNCCVILDCTAIRSGRHLDKVFIYDKYFDGLDELIKANNCGLAIQGFYDLSGNTVAIYKVDYAIEVTPVAKQRYEINSIDVLDRNYI